MRQKHERSNSFVGYRYLCWIHSLRPLSVEEAETKTAKTSIIDLCVCPMVDFTTNRDKKYSPYTIALPNDMTCWHFPTKTNLLPSEALTLILVTARNRPDESQNYVNAEIEKGWLDLPERKKRRIAGKIASMTRRRR